MNGNIFYFSLEINEAEYNKYKKYKYASITCSQTTMRGLFSSEGRNETFTVPFIHKTDIFCLGVYSIKQIASAACALLTLTFVFERIGTI